MADNYQADSNTTAGKIFASDEIIAGPTGDADWPFVKPAFGPLNTATIVQDAAGGRLPVKLGSLLESSAPVAGQLSLSGAEAALSTVAARRFRLKALPTNTDAIYLGPTGVTTGTGFPLFPSDMIDVEPSNLNVIHAIVGSGTQVLCYYGEV